MALDVAAMVVVDVVILNLATRGRCPTRRAPAFVQLPTILEVDTAWVLSSTVTTRDAPSTISLTPPINQTAARLLPTHIL